MNTCNTICYSYLCHENSQTGSVLRKIARMLGTPVEELPGIKVAGNTHSNNRIHSSPEDSEQLKGWKENEMTPIFYWKCNKDAIWFSICWWKKNITTFSYEGETGNFYFRYARTEPPGFSSKHANSRRHSVFQPVSSSVNIRPTKRGWSACFIPSVPPLPCSCLVLWSLKERERIPYFLDNRQSGNPLR